MSQETKHQEHGPPMKKVSRRKFLELAGVLAFTATLPIPQRAYGNMWSQVFGGSSREISPITPNEEFYITSYRTPPFVFVEDWTLTIKGLVKSPRKLNYSQLAVRPTQSKIVTLECVGNGVAGEAIGTAEWEGVPLHVLLDEAGVESKAYDVVFRAADGYSDSLTVERAMVGDVLIAYKMNGVTLPSGHGFPARIIVPGIYGMKNVQWLTEIELLPHDYKGYYQKNGWSDDATIKTMSSITDPQDGDRLSVGESKTIKGFAFAGTRGIRSVEITTDGGNTWNPASLKPALSPYAWVFWTYQWESDRLGDHRILVRAVDGTGELQSSTEQAPFPDGASGIHEVIVTVR